MAEKVEEKEKKIIQTAKLIWGADVGSWIWNDSVKKECIETSYVKAN